jgi:exopolyphosphatase/guanosine-5'-triphosphate,3'-diphosphate pyrophosphatase
MHIAVLDLGTNTFNLLVAELTDKTFIIKANDRIPVKIGKGGISNNIILPDAIDRALKAIETHKRTIDKWKASQINAYGTSALRTASNSNYFIERVRSEYGINIEIISGDREAELIYKGIRNSFEIGNKTALILDIGGGSNEFIIANKEKVFWKKSFPLGMARLIEKFKISDPISKNQISDIEDYFNLNLQELFEACNIYKPKTLIGAEGSFESFYSILKNQNFNPIQNTLSSIEIKMTDYKSVFNTIVGSTTKERLNMTGLEPYRVEMIAPAILFVNFVLLKLDINKIIVSFYSLKEGVVCERLGL